jgi:galactose mutarotase-like enzyme
MDGREQIVFEARLGDERIRAGRQGLCLEAARIHEGQCNKAGLWQRRAEPGEEIQAGDIRHLQIQ